MKALKGNKKIIWLSLTIITLVIISVLVVFSFYKNRIDTKVNNYIDQYLSDVMDESVERISVRINENFKALEVLALFISEYDDIKSDEVVDMLSKQARITLVNQYNVITPDGKGINGYTDIENILEQDFVQKAFNGERSVSDIITSMNNQEQEVVFNVPIFKGTEVVGILQFEYYLETFAELMGDSVLDKKADTFITQLDGTLVSRPETASGGSNIYTLLENIMIGDAKTIEKLKSKINNGETGTIVIGEEKYKRYICYNHITANDWYAITIMSANVVENNILDVSTMGIEIGQAIITIFVLLIFYIFAIYIHAALNTRLNYQKYKIVAEQSNSIIFEYNYEKDTAITNTKWEEKLGYEPVDTEYISKMTTGEIVVAEDIEIFESIFEELRQGKDIVQKEIRIYNKEMNPVWHIMKASSIKNRKGRIIKVIGRYINIDNNKREVEYFKEQAQLDLVTGLFNKETTAYKISAVLSTLGHGIVSALLYIDIDDFKVINDTYGHNFGDYLVENLTRTIKDSLPESAFAGRVGGDEFIIMLSQVKNSDEAMDVANRLLRKASEVTLNHHPEVKLSISIGIAMAPKHGKDPRTLIKCADKAMYKAKEQGKKCTVLGE